jgi:putative membrane protein
MIGGRRSVTVCTAKNCTGVNPVRSVSRTANEEFRKESHQMKKQIALAAVASLLAVGGSALAQDKPTDPQIAGVVQTANKIDIDQAKLALKKTKNPQVKQFAQQMIDDHTKLMGSVNDLAKKLNVTPADSDISKSLKSGAAAENKKLQGLSGKAFDKEYIDHEVAYHQQVIDAAGKVLIPNAQNADLKSALEGAAPLLQGHLDHAKQIQSSLGGGSGSGGGHSH